MNDGYLHRLHIIMYTYMDTSLQHHKNGSSSGAHCQLPCPDYTDSPVEKILFQNKWHSPGIWNQSLGQSHIQGKLYSNNITSFTGIRKFCVVMNFNYYTGICVLGRIFWISIWRLCEIFWLWEPNSQLSIICKFCHNNVFHLYAY